MTVAADLTREGDVVTLALRPVGRTLSLSLATVAALGSALDELERIDGVRCVVVTGSGPTFLVGADIKQIEASSVAENLAYNERLIAINERIARLPVPVVAGVNGHAFGGGLELALACTLRVLSADALVGLPEVKLGILPGAGGVVRLPRVVGRGAALRMLLTGASVDAAEALRLGLVDEVAPADAVADRARALAQEIAACAPLAVGAVLAASRELDGVPLAAGVGAVHARLRPLLASDDAAEGIAAFLAKRPPVFTGR